MNLSKEVIKEIKSMIAYYRYRHLKTSEVLIKVFKVRYDTERKEVYMNQLDEQICSNSNLLMPTRVMLSIKHNFEFSKDLLVMVVINKNGKIVLKDDESLMIYHNNPAKVNDNLINSRVTIDKELKEGVRAELDNTKPFRA